MGGVASTTSSSRHSSNNAALQGSREASLPQSYPSGRRGPGPGGHPLPYPMQRGDGGRGPRSQEALQRNPSMRNSMGPPMRGGGMPGYAQANMGAGNSLSRIGSTNSLGRMNSTNSLTRMNSTSSFGRMNSTNSLTRMNSNSSLGRMNSGCFMRSGSGMGSGYFRDLGASGRMGSHIASMIRSDTGGMSRLGSFYESLQKCGDSANESGGMYPVQRASDSFRKPHPAKSSRTAPPWRGRGRGSGMKTPTPSVQPQQSAATLQRYDSTNKLQRQYSISGQFHQFNPEQMGWARGGMGAAAAGRGYPAGRGMMSFGMGPPAAAMGNRNQPVPMGQRRLANDPKRRGASSGSEIGAVGETTSPPPAGNNNNGYGAPMLERKDSQKRVGMYFKKVNSDKDGMEYRKEGENSEVARNPDYNSENASNLSYIKPILLFEAQGNSRASTVEIDGCTVRYSKDNDEEVHKYDMSDIVYVKVKSDAEVQSDSLDEIREHFVHGSNVGMIMADMDSITTNPNSWFSWLALKYVVKETFGRIDSGSEFTMSACLLQDDQVMDLFDDGNHEFVPLNVAESPFFGNVAHGLTYVVASSARDFNKSLKQCLTVAGTQMENNKDEEQGIVVVTCLLKQIRTSKSGNKDVVISSIFASGVGDGIIHYNRILDKNPAEPRAVFYAALHRSVYSTAIFSSRERSQALYQCLCTLQRFSKVETRKPKVNSVLMFTHFAETTISKMKDDLTKTPKGPRYQMMERFLEKMQAMLADAKAMLDDPHNSVPKTYM